MSLDWCVEIVSLNCRERPFTSAFQHILLISLLICSLSQFSIVERESCRFRISAGCSLSEFLGPSRPKKLPIPHLNTKTLGNKMDPTLAPGYVPPKNGKDKPWEGHHWAEIQKTGTGTAAHNVQNGDNSPPLSSSEMSRTVTPPAHIEERPQHSRMRSWRAGRSALSDGEGIGGPADLEEVPVGVKRQALRLEDYAFPDHRLRTVMDGISQSETVTNVGR
jgi:hypothetical protein